MERTTTVLPPSFGGSGTWPGSAKKGARNGASANAAVWTRLGCTLSRRGEGGQLKRIDCCSDGMAFRPSLHRSPTRVVDVSFNAVPQAKPNVSYVNP